MVKKEFSNKPKGVFAYIKMKSGIPPFLVIIFIIIGFALFKDFIPAYLFSLVAGFIVLLVLSRMERLVSGEPDSAYFDDITLPNAPTKTTSIEKLNDDINQLKKQLSSIKANYKKSIDDLDSKIMHLEAELKDIIILEDNKNSDTITIKQPSLKAANSPQLSKEIAEQKDEIKKEIQLEDMIKTDDNLASIKEDKVKTITPPPPPPILLQTKDTTTIEKEDISTDSEKENELFIDSILQIPVEEKILTSALSNDKNSDDEIIFTQKEKKSSFIDTNVKPIFEGIGSQISESIMGPFSSILEKGRDLYNYYKDQGKLPVFYLTTAGTIALLLCFAYLLQYSFTNIFNEIAKMAVGLISSTALLIGGHILHRKKSLKEFGSVLIGAGVSINYLLIYYASIVYSFFPPIVGFGLLGFNTIIGYFLSMKYETKIATTVSFLGGAFTPFLLGAETEFATFYLFYLVLIAFATIHVSRKIKWPSMAHGSVIIITTLFQFIISKGEKAYIQLIPVHILFYLYMGYVFFREGKLQEKFIKVITLILIGSLTTFLYNCFTLSENVPQGLILLSNAIPFIVTSIFLWRIMTNIVKTIIFSIVSMFTLLSIPSLLGLDIGSYIWVTEGLLMVYLGYQLKLSAVVKEGYAVFFFSLIHACFGLISIFNSSGELAITQAHTISLVAIPLFTAAMAFITILFKREFNFIDKLVHRLSHTIMFFSTPIATVLLTLAFSSHLSIYILLPIVFLVSLYASKFQVYFPKHSTILIHLLAIIMIFHIGKGSNLIMSILWTFEILIILWLTNILRLRVATSSTYTLFFSSIISYLMIVIKSIEVSYSNSLNFIGLSIVPMFLFNSLFILIVRQLKLSINNYDKVIKATSHTLNWTWISISAFCCSYFYLKDQTILALVFSLLLSAIYANKFKVYLGKNFMPLLYAALIIVGFTSVLHTKFIIDLSLAQFSILGVAIALYIPLYIFILKNPINIENFLFKSLKEVLIGWSIILTMLIATTINAHYNIIGIVALVPFLLWISNRFKITLASFYLPFVLLFSLFISSAAYLLSGQIFVFNIPFISMLLITIYTLIIDLLYSKDIIKENFQFTKSLKLLSREMVSFIPTIFFLTVIYHNLLEWFWVLSIVPAIFLLIRGVKTKSLFSQYGGFILIFFPVVGYLQLAIKSNTLLILHLPLAAKIAATEIALSFWGMTHIATKAKLHNGISKLGKTMNTLFFVFLPLTHIATIFDLAPNYLSLSLISSIAISYTVSRFLKSNLYYIEYSLIWTVSFALTIYMILTGSGALFSLDTLAIALIILLSIIHLVIDKTNNPKLYEISPYKILYKVYWLSYSVIPVLISLSVLKSPEIAFLGFIAWYFIISRFSYKIPAIFKMAPNMFIISGWTLFPILIYAVVNAFIGSRLVINLTTGFFSVFGIIIILYGSKDVIKKLNLNENNYLGISEKALQWLTHITITVYLMAIPNIFAENFIRPAQSIFLLVHAVFLTFHSYSKRYHLLIRYSALLYFLFTAKVIFVDLATFSIPQKVVVFMVISLLMLGASFVLQKRGMTWSSSRDDNKE